MSAFPCFGNLEQLARILGEEVTGTQLTNIFSNCGIQDTSGESTKWKRIYHTLGARQNADRCGNHVAALIIAVMSPARFISERDRFEGARQQLNAILSFDGLEFTDEGRFREIKAAKTISEAEQRAKILGDMMLGRKVHAEVLRFCKAELLQDNYFHAVFEATKGLAQRMRDMTGLGTDGAELIDRAFSIKNPMLAINSLTTETEKSEHTGFAMLLKGCFGAVRNPRAHEPRIMWKDEHDAADYLTLISLLHRKLDEAVSVPSLRKEG
jgi:uncharacterized protein (TIGR02391 family)